MINNPIGIFDSGIGGKSILKTCQKLLPRQKFIYLSDKKNCPYGDKTKSQIKRLAENCVRRLAGKNCRIIVIACNTATVSAIDYLRKKYPEITFVGVVPVIKPAVKASRTGHIVVLSTKATAESAYLKSLIKRHARGKTVYSIGCPGLAELVEQGKARAGEVKVLLEKHLKPVLNDEKIDTVAVGCTHYILIKTAILKFFKKRTKFVEPSLAVARQVKNILKLWL